MDRLSPARERDFAVDLVKCIAIFGVIIIHTCSYSHPQGSFAWYSSLFWGSIVRGSVPLFFMCSGALFLGSGRPVSVRKLFTKTLPRILAAMLVWSMLYKLWHLATEGGVTASGLITALKETLLLRQEFHFYYLQIILIVYLMLPVTELIVQNASRRRLEYALGVWFVFGIVYPSLLPLWPFRLLGGIPLQYKLNMTWAAVGYGILGAYMKKYPPKRGLSASLAAAGFALIFCGTAIVSARQGKLYSGFFEGMAPGACLLAAGIFGLCLGAKPPRASLRRIAEFGSKASFCIYLVHVFFIYIFSRLGVSAGLLPPLIGVPLLALAYLACSTAVYLVLSRIPIVNRWLI